MNDRAARRGSALSGLALVALGAGALAFARRYEIGRLSAPGPGFVPQIAAVLLAISGAIAALRSMLEVRSEPGATDSSETTLWRAIGTIVALACFVGLFEWAGFLLATPLLLGATAWLAGAKKWGDILALAVGGTAVFYWLFAKVLSSQLPVGLLGS